MADVYEYAYLYFLDTSEGRFAVVVTSKSTRAEKIKESRLAVLDRLGRDGWLIGAGNYVIGNPAPEWLYQQISRDVEPTERPYGAQGYHEHFLHRRVD